MTVKFEVWGLQTRVEQFVHKVSETGAGCYPSHKQNLSTTQHRNVTLAVKKLGSSAESAFRPRAEPKSSPLGIKLTKPGAAQV